MRITDRNTSEVQAGEISTSAPLLQKRGRRRISRVAISLRKNDRQLWMLVTVDVRNVWPTRLDHARFIIKPLICPRFCNFPAEQHRKNCVRYFLNILVFPESQNSPTRRRKCAICVRVS